MCTYSQPSPHLSYYFGGYFGYILAIVATFDSFFYIGYFGYFFKIRGYFGYFLFRSNGYFKYFSKLLATLATF